MIRKSLILLTAIVVFVFFLFTDNSSAAFIRNISEGCFEFRLDIKDSGRHVNYAKLTLSIQNMDRRDIAIVFDDITVTSTGQVFKLTQANGNFSSVSAFLTDGMQDWINALLRAPTRTAQVEGTEPDLLFGDPSGNSGIDFSGRFIESINLLVTDLFLFHGFDPIPYSQIVVQAKVTIDYGGAPSLVADFSATPTSGAVPLAVGFIDKSRGNITSWKWGFGDNSTSTLKNPSHTYSTPGKYPVSLTVRGPDGSDTRHAIDFISVYSKVSPGIQMLLLDE